MSARSATQIEGEGGRQYHIGLAHGEVGGEILLVGDPARADLVAEHFENVRLTRKHREYVTHTGIRAGREITVMATGMGCDNTEIAVVELLRCHSSPVMIRVGSSGGLQPDISVGEPIISTGSLRLENTSLGFVDPGYPALAHHEVILALVSAAEKLGEAYHLGITATAPGFYGWQGREGDVLPPRFPDLPKQLQRQGVKNFEMETSTLFTLGSLAKIRVGAVCAAFANRITDSFIADEDKESAEQRAIAIGLSALDFLHSMDEQAGGRRFHLRS